MGPSEAAWAISLACPAGISPADRASEVSAAWASCSADWSSLRAWPLEAPSSSTAAWRAMPSPHRSDNPASSRALKPARADSALRTCPRRSLISDSDNPATSTSDTHTSAPQREAGAAGVLSAPLLSPETPAELAPAWPALAPNALVEGSKSMPVTLHRPCDSYSPKTVCLRTKSEKFFETFGFAQ